jgi:hypothetical protein
MASCRLTSLMAPANGTRGPARCETHDWTFDGPAAPQCPIGRIEEAADRAIARIREAGCGPTIILAEAEECRSSCPKAPSANI